MIKKNIKRIFALVLAFSLFASLTVAGAAGAGTYKYTNSQVIGDNLSYVNTISYNTAGRQESHMASLTPGGAVHPIVMACDTIYGGMTISRVIKYAQNLGYNVLGGVNTDFFSTKTHVPLGIVIENGIYKSSPEGFNAMTISENGQTNLKRFAQVYIKLENHGGAAGVDNSGKSVNVNHFNKYRTDSGLYLFSSYFSTVSTRTYTDGWMVRFKILEGEMTASGKMELEVAELIEGSDAVPIGDGYLILTASTASGMGTHFEKFAVGDKVTLTTTCNDASLENAKWATGGGDILVSDGAITDTATWDKAIAAKNPRTAFGIKADGTIVSYVVDGRRSSYSVGLTLKELAEEFLAMGCIAAINFDGGGSSALSMRIPGSSSSKTINSPSDSSERSCATYVLFVTDNKADGVPKHLSLSSDGKMVLAGSVINLEAKATDTGFLPSSAPGDIVYTSATGLGTFSGKTYTAGQTAGKDTIGMSSAETGASGSGTLHILTNVDSITVKNKATNKAVTSISLKPGETFQFDTSATYLTRSVLSSAEAYQYTVSGDIGTVSNTGLYTAGGTPGASGTITVSFGGVSKSVSVTVAAQLQDIRGHWAETYIRTLFDAGIVEGVSDTEFLPNANISRGDFILMMYRSANKPSVSQSSSFSDVKASDYYASAIAWAEEKGIAQGTGDGKFNPTSPLTREQAFAFLYRALSLFGVTYTDGSMEDLAAFPDCSSVSDYAVIPTATLVNLEFVGGSDGLIVPQGKLTRAEMSKILCCMLETV